MRTQSAQTQRVDASSNLSNATLRLADNSLIELFEDGAVLFSEQEQQLSRLEGASALLTPLLERGATFGELVGELGRRGVEADAAGEWTISLLHQLANLSLLQAQIPDVAAPPTQVQSLGLASFAFDLSYGSEELSDRIAPIFAHLERPSSTGVPFRIDEFGAGLVRIEEGGGPARLLPADQLAVRLKALLLERLFESRKNFAALHAAFLSNAGRGVLLLGSPGAGKSTLALALMRRGYLYGSDDVTLVNSDGTVTGVPLAPGLKQGSWPIAQMLGAELMPLPAHMRPDRQQLRFVRVAPAEIVESSLVGTIVSLRREPGSAGELRPMGSQEALAELLRESRASGGRCTVQTMSALAELVRGAASYHLDYAEAMKGADLIASLRAS